MSRVMVSSSDSHFKAASKALITATRRLAAATQDAEANRQYDEASAAVAAIGEPTDPIDLLWWAVAITEARTRVGRASDRERWDLLTCFRGLCAQTQAMT